MTLTLTIENFDVLPDGGPLSIDLSGRRGIDIGRDQYLDWTLPDPDREISGKHAEVRYRDGGYWIRDVSSNGTFLNQSGQRLQENHRLKNGDRLEIGRYIIRVKVDDEDQPAASPMVADPVAPGDFWEPSGEVAAPIPSSQLRSAASSRPVRPDFVDWAVDLPSEPRSNPRPRDDAMDWARTTPEPPPPPRPQMPSPRRPASEPAAESVWAADLPSAPRASPDRSADFEDAPVRAAAERPVPPLQPVREASPFGDDDAAPRKRPDPRPSSSSNDDGEFVRRFAAGLGIAPEILSWQDSGDLAEEAGVLLRLSAESLKQLLAARAESKRTAKAANQTTIQALENNPLKFAPTVDDALRIMLGRPSSGYLEARRAMDTGFRDLKTHQIKTYAAMQNALRLLLDELSPEGVEASDEKDKGLGALLGSRKARLWDIYATRWAALSSPHEDGMVDAFMMFFADCYDRGR
ncbi:type VI secretion system-associated FHA domain protein TagH [Methylobacterium brachythecii]|uniref:FHA domain-containing protein n=1 Tax=Methylobacterium brachythecii TaxID=1176177 RepID=A0A7W6AMG3_9HYPH|nr:type VI secretion system-associated FHA domain protein TagH [Methylobacterium brachythecii]MBB3902372.1 type VI secretion system protein ImpI [Methylobacterium brachythecii]GLS42220.1 FHA domain-containing protein [Methylobacterium brachythecii]